MSVYQRLFRNLLSISPRLLPHGSNGSTKSLAPLLLSALLFNKGIMNLPDDDVVAEAIRCSIIPVSSSMGGKWVDITAEPIVEEALRKVLVQMADDKKEIIMRLVLSGVKCQDKGITAETAFTYFLVLCSFVNIQKQRPNLLSGLIAPFFENIHQQPPQLSAFTCEVTTLVDMSGWAAEGNCFLRRFVKEDGSYDTSILLVNIPITAGVDVAFLVVNKSAPLNSPLRTRLVALQLKNRKKGQLKSALLTIHSGTQYMTNKQREYAIHNATRTPRDAEEDWLNKFPRSDSGGIDFLEWNDYQNQFAANHPVLCNKWIRIAVFAQPIHDAIYNFLQDFPSSISSLYRQVNIDEGITGSTVSNSEGAKLDDHSDYADDEEEEVDDPEVKRLEVAADSSPVVVLTMNSKN